MALPVRPDRVYDTGVLTAIPGYNPVADAQRVAARFTAIWAPSVSDAPPAASAAGVTAVITPAPNRTPNPSTAPSTAPGMGGPGLAPSLADRIRAWYYRGKLKRALRGYQGRTLSLMGPVPGGQPSLAPGGPDLHTQQSAGLAITSQSMGSRPFPPASMPAAAAAAQISPYGAAQRAGVQAFIAQAGLPGPVAAQAAQRTYGQIASYDTSWPWWSKS
jgi:hypothetical protein